jgi:hypothetical protein
VKYVLDTNTCIAYLRGQNPLLGQRVLAVSEADIVVPAPVRAELYYGATYAITQSPGLHAQPSEMALGLACQHCHGFHHTLYWRRNPALAQGHHRCDCG